MRRFGALLVAAITSSTAAHAAHPFISEDPGTQGTGRFELEMGFAARQGDPTIPGRSAIVSPQLSIGAREDLDLIALGAWVDQSVAQGPAVVGNGDTALDFKWRFYERGSLAFAVRAGLDLPTGDSNTGLGAGQLGGHVIAIVSVTLGAFAVYGNADYAYTRAPGTRSNLGGFSVALTRPDDKPIQTFIEVAAFSNPDPSNPQWPAVARTGAIYTVNDWMDVDAGFQARLNRSAARAAYLLGATVRW